MLDSLKLPWHILEADASRAARQLMLCGAGMLATLLAFAWRYPLAGNSHTLTDIGKLSRYAAPEFAGFAGGVTLLFTLYILALRACRLMPAERALPIVFAIGALMAAGAAAMYPVGAIDLFLYATRSRLLSSYGANPSAVPFSQFPGDAWTPFITGNWAARASPYGPLWNLIAAPITAAAGEQITIALVGYKLLMLAALLAGGWAIARALAASAPADRAAGVLLYLWNPLVLWEGIGNGHNDVLLMLVLLLALWAWVARRDQLVIPLLVAAAMIKYVTLPLIPLAAIAIWRRPGNYGRRARLAAWSILLSELAAAVALYPFYDLRAMIDSLREQGEIFYTSPAAAALALLSPRYFPAATVTSWAIWVGRALLLAALLWQAAQLWRRPERLPRACFEVLFVLLLVAMPSARVWYVIWLVGAAALLPWGWPAWRAIAWSAGGLASYGLLIWIEAWLHPGYGPIQVAVVPVILGGTLLLSAAELVWASDSA